LLLITLAVLLVYGVSTKGSAYPLISRADIARRSRAVDRLTTRPSTTRTYSQQARTTTMTTPRGQQVRSSTRTKAKQKQRTPSRTTVQTTKTKSKTQRGFKKLISTRVFNKFKPKASIIAIEDFKCIFCFELPKMPKDKNRGIILCPNCRYPAHADEFKDWLRSSKLCSRCDSPMPGAFVRNPKIISAENYVKVIQKFRSRKR